MLLRPASRRPIFPPNVVPTTFDFLNEAIVLDSRITATRASSAWYYDDAGVLTEASTDVMRSNAFVDHDPVTGEPLGWLIEEQRVNSIRNPRAEGGVAGTPGTSPTNWSVDGAENSVTRSISLPGSVQGVPCLDVILDGVATASGAHDTFYESGTGVAASAGQIWTESVRLALASGDLTGISSIQLILFYYNASVVFVGSAIGPDIKGEIGAELKDFALTGTAPANTAFVRPLVKVSYTSGATVSLTIRHGAPQLELAAFATSPILPPVSTLAASTRARDIATITDLSTINFNAAEGSVLVEFVAPTYGSSGLRTALHISDGTLNNRIFVYINDASDDTIRFAVTSGGVNQAVINTGLNIPAGNTARIAVSWKVNSFRIAVNGTGYAEDVSGTVPVGLTQIELGRQLTSEYLNSHLRKAIYIPRQLSQAELNTWSALP